MRAMLIGTDLALLAHVLAYAGSPRRHQVTESPRTESLSDLELWRMSLPCKGVDAYTSYNEDRARREVAAKAYSEHILDRLRLELQRELIWGPHAEAVRINEAHEHCFELGCTRPISGEAHGHAGHICQEPSCAGFLGAPEMTRDELIAFNDREADAPEFYEKSVAYVQDPLSRGAEPGHPMGKFGNNAHWSRTLVLEPRPYGAGSYQLVYKDNGVLLGDVIAEVDGYYKFWPEQHGGYWETYVMRAIAECIDELNEPWDEQIRNDPRIGGGPQS